MRVSPRLILVASLWLATMWTARARADGLEVFAPEEQEPIYSLEVHGAAVFPLERGAICPADAGCVLGGGFGAGGFLIRQGPDGVGFLVGYEVWLLDGGSVYEIGALHSLQLGVRWVMDVTSRVQPLLQASIGAILLTDPAQATAAGGMLSGGAGLQVELTTDVSVSLTAQLGLYALSAFQTRDGVLRAADFGLNVTLATTAGLVVVLGSPGVR